MTQTKPSHCQWFLAPENLCTSPVFAHTLVEPKWTVGCPVTSFCEHHFAQFLKNAEQFGVPYRVLSPEEAEVASILVT